MGALINLSDSVRAENYDVDANDIQRYVPLAGLRIEQTCRHGALEQTQTLREACSLRSSSLESSDIICEEKFCVTRQDLLDCLLASDDQYKVVAAIGEKFSAIHFWQILTTQPRTAAAIISSFNSEASFDVIKVLFD